MRRLAAFAYVLIAVLSNVALAELQPENVLVLYYCDDLTADPTTTADCVAGSPGGIDQTNDSYAIAQHYLTVHPTIGAIRGTNPDTSQSNSPLLVKNLADFGFQYTDLPPITEAESAALIGTISGNRASPYFVTPGAFESWIRGPLASYVQWYNTNHDPDILSIVTCRGIPATVSVRFTSERIYDEPGTTHSCRSHQTRGFKGSVEGALSRLYDGPFTWNPNSNPCGDDGTLPHDQPPNPPVPPNPFFEVIGRSFSDLVEGGCITAGNMLLVSRLDSDFRDLDQDGFPDVPDVNSNGRTDVEDVNRGTRLAAVVALIDRSNGSTLPGDTGPIPVNTFATTLVIDRGGPDVGSSGGVDLMHALGWCTLRDNSSDFYDGVFDGGADAWGCPGTGQIGGWDASFEGLYSGANELYLGSPGRNASGDRPDPMYLLEYQPHPAAMTRTAESWSGWTVHTPSWLYRIVDDGLGEPATLEPRCADSNDAHGQILNWIAQGGSFGVLGVKGLRLAEFRHDDLTIRNFYQEGLTWGESVYTEMFRLGSTYVPIGDPLARVQKINPDVNGDKVVNSADLVAWDQQHVDLDQNGNPDDDRHHIELIVNTLFPGGRDCSDPPFSPGSPCDRRGDLDNSTCVTVDDLQLFIDTLTCVDSGMLAADANGDMVVDLEDLNTIMCNFGQVILVSDVDGDGDFDADDRCGGPGEPQCVDVARPQVTGQPGQIRPCPDGQVSFIFDAVAIDAAIACSASLQPPDLTPGGAERLLLEQYNAIVSRPDIPSIDCNENGIFDACELASAPEDDCNADGIPDICTPELDTDNDTVIDSCQFDCPADCSPPGS